MRITVKLKPGSKEEKVEKTGENEFSIRVKAPAREGRANERLVELLSEYFDISKNRISIFKGHKTRNKLVDIL